MWTSLEDCHSGRSTNNYQQTDIFPYHAQFYPPIHLTFSKSLYQFQELPYHRASSSLAMAPASEYTLYHNYFSICSIMMRYVVAVRGEPVDAASSMGVVKEKMIDIFNEEQLQEDYLLHVNPRGQVNISHEERSSLNVDFNIVERFLYWEIQRSLTFPWLRVPRSRNISPDVIQGCYLQLIKMRSLLLYGRCTIRSIFLRSLSRNLPNLQLVSKQGLSVFWLEMT